MNSAHLRGETPDHQINLSSNQCMPVVTALIRKRYRKLMSSSNKRRPLPGSREEHHNHSQWAGVPDSGSPAKGLMCASVPCEPRRAEYRLKAANILDRLWKEAISRVAVNVNQPLQNVRIVDFFGKYCEAGRATMETFCGLNGGANAWAPARINAGGTATLDGVGELRSYLLLATGHDGLLHTGGDAMGTPENFELVGLYGASGMSHGRDYRRFGASHRAGGATLATGRAPGQLRQTSQDLDALLGALADGPVTSRDLSNSWRRGSGWCSDSFQKISGYRNRSTGLYD